MKTEEKTLKKETVYRGKIINIRCDTALLPNGEEAKREVVEHNGGVAVLPLTENDEVILVEQFRYPYMENTLEIPAGKRNSIDEDPFVCGQRELSEETGATAEKYYDLGLLYPTPGYCGEIIYLYAATGLSYGEQHTDDDEFLNVMKIPLENAVDMVMRGEIRDSKTQAAILKVKIMRERGEI